MLRMTPCRDSLAKKEEIGGTKPHEKTTPSFQMWNEGAVSSNRGALAMTRSPPNGRCRPSSRPSGRAGCSTLPAESEGSRPFRSSSRPSTCWSARTGPSGNTASALRPYCQIKRRMSPRRWPVRNSVERALREEQILAPARRRRNVGRRERSRRGTEAGSFVARRPCTSARSRAPRSASYKKSPRSPARSAASAWISRASVPSASGVGDLRSRYFVVRNSSVSRRSPDRRR